MPDIHRERELARKAFILGIPTAISYDVVKVGDSYGSVFELLNAKSFSKLMAAEPEKLDEYVAQYIDLLKKIHSTEVKPGDMPDMKAVTLDWVEFLEDCLPEKQYTKLHRLVEDIPEDHHMIHGDYHTNNVMAQNGEILLIDMDTISMGHPVFEFASVFLAYVGFCEEDHSVAQSFLGLTYEMTQQIWQKSLRLYLNTDEEEVVNSVAEKSMIIGYTRLLRRIIRRGGWNTEDGRSRIALCKSRIEELLDRVDSLVF